MRKKSKALAILKKPLLLVLVVVTSGIPNAALVLAKPPAKPARPVEDPSVKEFESASQQMAELLARAKTETALPMLELQKVLQKAALQPQVDATNSISTATANALVGLKSLRTRIDRVAKDLSKFSNLNEPLFAVIVSYYSFKGLLELTYEAFREKSGLDFELLNGLNLIVPSEVARMVARIQGQQSMAAGGDAYDIGFKISNVANGYKELRLVPKEANRFRLGAFMAFPSEATAKRALMYQASKLAFLKHAMLNSYLHPDEKKDVVLPGGLDPAIYALDIRADAVAHEAEYRNYITGPLLKALSDEIGKGRNQFRKSASIFFGLASLQFAHLLDQKKYEQKGGQEGVTDIFLKIEEQSRAENLKKALKSSALFLTEMPREDFRVVLREALFQSLSQTLVGILRALGVDEERMSPRDNMHLNALILDFFNDTMGTEVVSNAVLDEFLKSKTHVDVMSSFRRYDLAVKILAGVDALEGIKYALARLSDAQKTPTALLPKKPDAAMVLLALAAKSDPVPPRWTIEMLQYFGAKVPQVKDNALLRDMLGIIRSAPDQLVDLALETRNLLSPEVVAEINQLHRRQVGLNQYRWHSLDAKIRNLGKRAQAEATKKVLLNFLKLNKYAGIVAASALNDLIRMAFNDLVDDGLDRLVKPHDSGWSAPLDKALRTAQDLGKETWKDIKTTTSSRHQVRLEGINDLLEELEKGQRFIRQFPGYTQKIFAPAKEREEYFRSLLEDRELFTAYLQAQLKNLQNTVPLLFMQAKLSSKSQAETALEQPVVLADLVIRMKKAIPAMSAEIAITRNALEKLSPDVLRKPGILGKPIKSLPLKPEHMVVAAMNGATQEDVRKGFVESSVRYLMEEGVPKWVFGLGEPLFGLSDKVNGLGPFKTVKAGNLYLPTQDSDWPNYFAVRDVVPALFDTGASLKTKTQRIILASLLAPYLKGSLTATQNEIDLLVDPKTDHTKALFQSEAYRTLLGEAGDSVAGGLEIFNKEALKWRRLLEDYKKVTTKLQEGAHYVFYETMVLPLSMGAHELGGAYMVVAAGLDLLGDIAIFVDYWNTYAELRPFALGSGLGKSSVTFSEIEGLRTEMNSMAEVLVERIPNDAMFIGPAISSHSMKFSHLLFKNRIFLRRVTALQEQGKLPADFKLKDFNTEQALMAYELTHLGIEPNMNPKEFMEIYQKKKSELSEKAKTDAHVQSDLERWDHAAKLVVDFNVKYVPVMETLMAEVFNAKPQKIQKAK